MSTRSDFVIQVSSLTVAASAMVLTGIQSWTAIYTAKIQTVPDLQFFEALDSDGKPGCSENAEGAVSGTHTLCLENTGLGPARLISFRATLANKNLSIPNITWNEIRPYFDPKVSDTIILTTDLAREQTIQPGKAIPLLRYKSNKIPQNSPIHILLQTKQLNFEVCYCSFYHDCRSVGISYIGTPEFMPPPLNKCESRGQNHWWKFLEPSVEMPTQG